MNDLKFNEYWLIILNPNPNYDRKNKNHTFLMQKHFEFIDQQLEASNLFVAIPMLRGGLYFFKGTIPENNMKIILAAEKSIEGGVFLADLRRAYVQPNHLRFTLEEYQNIKEFHGKRAKITN